MVITMDKFLSCDWGTSSFRLRLIKTEGLKVLAEELNGDGIADTFKSWTNANVNESERLVFYQSYILKQIKKLENVINYSLKDLPLLLSGMASSSIGMMELPYKELPFKTDGSDVNSKTIEPSENFPNKLFIISGGKTGEDVLRGEETLLIGSDVEEKNEESVYIYPGTHSKHIYVQKGMATHFQTFMTGEFFDLLSTKSILSNSVEKNKDAENGIMDSFFEKGVIEGASSNLLNIAFHVRTNQLFKKNTPVENYHYLSGLLIGAELKDLVQNPPHAIFLVSGKSLRNQYWQALTLLSLDNKLEFKDADEALISGQFCIYKKIRNLHT